jgi:hypothetical protein
LPFNCAHAKGEGVALSPVYVITPAVATALMAIEADRQVIMELPITVELLATSARHPALSFRPHRHAPVPSGPAPRRGAVGNRTFGHNSALCRYR